MGDLKPITTGVYTSRSGKKSDFEIYPFIDGMLVVNIKSLEVPSLKKDFKYMFAEQGTSILVKREEFENINKHLENGIWTVENRAGDDVAMPGSWEFKEQTGGKRILKRRTSRKGHRKHKTSSRRAQRH